MEDAEAGKQREARADQGPDFDTGLQVRDIAQTLLTSMELLLL